MSSTLKTTKIQLLLIVLATLLFWGYQYTQAQANHLPQNTTYELCFSPDGNCEAKLVRLIRSAKQSIYIQSYSFTSTKIANALKKSLKRGTTVRVIADRSLFDPANRYSKIGTLIRAGVPVWVDSKVNIQHNKVMIIDESIVETGSYNFTVSANRFNAENLLIIHDTGLAAQYLSYWQQRQQLATPAQRYHFKARRFH